MSKPNSPSGPAPKPDGKLLRITMYIKKLPEVTDEFFHAYWANNHIAPALLNETFRRNIVRYNQQHISPADREKAKTLGLPVLEFDGIADIWVKTLDDWMEAMTDPKFIAVTEGDDKHFIQQPIHLTLGFDHLVKGEPWPTDVKAKL